MTTPNTIPALPVVTKHALTEDEIIQKRMDATTPQEKARWSAELAKFDVGYVAHAVKVAEETLTTLFRECFMSEEEAFTTTLTAATSRQLPLAIGEANGSRYFVQISRVVIPVAVKPPTQKPAPVGSGVTAVPPGTPDDNIPVKKPAK